jgi:hypothetical protein
MKPECSLPHSQVRTTCLYPEPAQFTTHFLKIHFNIILPLTTGSPQWSLSLRFLHQNPVHASPLHHSSYIPRPSHYSRFYHLHNSGWVVQITKFLIIWFCSHPSYLVPLRPKYSQYPILKHPQLTFLPHCQQPSFTPKQNNRQNYSPYRMINQGINFPCSVGLPWVRLCCCHCCCFCCTVAAKSSL